MLVHTYIIYYLLYLKKSLEYNNYYIIYYKNLNIIIILTEKYNKKFPTQKSSYFI